MTANIIRLIVLAAVWGGSFLFMRMEAPIFGAPMLIELRVGIAALFLLEAAWWMGRRLPELHHWRRFLVMGLFNGALPFLCYGYAARTIPASLLSILNATAPIFGAITSAFWLRMPVNRDVMLGLALGIGGVVLLVGSGVPGPVESDAAWWPAVATALAAPLCYGIAGTYAAAHAAAMDPFDTAHGSMWMATLLTLPLLWASPVETVPSWTDWAAVSALGVVCTGAAFMIYFRLLRDIGPMRALSVTFLIPAFGVLWGALFLDEPLSWRMLAGGSVVLLGTGLTNGVVRLSRRAKVIGQGG